MEWTLYNHQGKFLNNVKLITCYITVYFFYEKGEDGYVIFIMHFIIFVIIWIINGFSEKYRLKAALFRFLIPV